VDAGLNPFELYEATYVMALIIDITERKIKEKELSHWSRILEGLLNEIFVFDAVTFKFINVNNESRRNIGFDMIELAKMTLVSI